MALGTIELLRTAAILGCVTAIVTDIWRGKIFNALTFPLLGLGFVFQAVAQGPAGLGAAALGAFVGLVCFGAMHAGGFMGAGDVKFATALGAWLGAGGALELVLASVLVGGVLAIGQLALRGQLGGFIFRMQDWVHRVFTRKSLRERPVLDARLRFPFGVPIGICAVIAIAGGDLQSGLNLLWSWTQRATGGWHGF